MGRQKQSGLWVMGLWVVGGAWMAGPTKSPRQDEAAAVVRLVWPAGASSSSCGLVAHGPLEDIAESEAGSTAEHGREGPGRRLDGCKIRFGCPRSQSGSPGVDCMRFSGNNGCEVASAAWVVDVWMRGCVGAWMCLGR